MNPQLLLAHESFVRGLARSLLADEASTDDVVQETWLAALRTPPEAGDGLEGTGRVRSWLARVVRNFARQQRRGDSRRDHRERATAKPEAIPSAAEIVEIEAVRRRLVEAVLALDEPPRSAILLRFYRHQPPRAIARQLGVPVETVRSRIKRGLQQLRARLGADDQGRSFLRAAPFLVVARLPIGELAGAASVTTLTAGALLMKTTTKVAALVLVLIGAIGVLSPVVLEKLSDAGGRKVADGGAAGAGSDSPPLKAEETAGEKPASTEANSELAPITGPSISGIVVDAAGKPVAGATVVSFPAGLDRAVAPDEGDQEGSVRRTLSGTDGRFVVGFEATAPVVSLLASARGLSPAFVSSATLSEDVTIRLDPARAITGFVRDLGGRPVAGAKVTWLGLLARGRLERTGISGPDGAYRVEGLPSIAAVRLAHGLAMDSWVEAIAEGFPPMMVRFDDARRRSMESAPTLDLYLPRGATLRGRVLDAETRAPIAAAPVVLWTTGASMGFGDSFGGFESPWGHREVGKTVTDDQGSFEIARIPAEGIPSPAAGHYDERGYALGQVAAMPRGYVGATAGVTLAAEGDSLEADVLCWPAAWVEGRVVDPEGRPVAGASAQCTTTDAVQRRVVWLPERYRRALGIESKTDADGRYRTYAAAIRGEALPAKLEAIDPNFSRLVEGWTESRPSVTVTIRGGEITKAPDLVLSLFPSITITVKDEGGKPIRGATVRWAYTYTTGLDGTCRVPYGASDVKRAKGKPVDIIAEARGYAKTMVSMPMPPPEHGLDIVLTKGHSVRGRVLDSNGAPATKVSVRVLNPSASAASKEASRQLFESREANLGALVVLGEAYLPDDSSFLIDGLPEGPYDVVALRYRQAVPGGRRSEVSALVPNVAADATDIVIQLPEEEAQAETFPVEGTVVDAKTRELLVRFDASLTKPGHEIASVKLAPGKFRFDVVPAGTWDLSVTAKGYAKFEKPGLQIGTESGTPAPLEIGMHPGITVQGRVVAPADVDLAKFELRFHKVGTAQVKRCVAQKDGSYRIADLSAGEYRLTTAWFSGSSYHTFLARDRAELIVLRDDEPIATRDFTFSPGGHVVLRTKSPRLPKGAYYDDLQAATEEQLRVLKASSAEIRDQKGGVVWSGLALDADLGWLGFLPGDYRVRVQLPDAEPQEKTVTVKAGEHARVTFEFP